MVTSTDVMRSWLGAGFTPNKVTIKQSPKKRNRPKKTEFTRQRWDDPEEVEKLKEMASTYTVREISEELGRTYTSVYEKLRKMGFETKTDGGKRQGWNDPEEYKKLVFWAGKVPIGLIAKELGRNYPAVYGKLHKLRIDSTLKGLATRAHERMEWPVDVPKEVPDGFICMI